MHFADSNAHVGMFYFSLPHRAEKTEVLSDDLLQVTSPLSSFLYNTGHRTIVKTHC